MGIYAIMLFSKTDNGQKIYYVQTECKKTKIGNFKV